MKLVQGATPICEGSCRLTSLERKDWVLEDCRSCKVRVGSNGNLFGKRLYCLVGRKGMHNGQLSLRAMPFIGVNQCTAASMELNEPGRQGRWMKLFSEYGFEAKYHLGKANVVVESWSRRKSEAKNKF
ncbi:hypothetical protein Tco_1313366 [Tanacetum coccineum]